MDMFMDKLAQKLTAQEMIRANMAADAEEMDKLKGRNREYSECLDQMKKLVDESIAKVNQLKAEEAGNNAARDAEVMAALEAMKTELAEALESMKAEQEGVRETLQSQMEEKLEATNESVHKECVKVYRNVQAVVVEESGKQTESLKENLTQTVSAAVKGHSGKLNAILVLSIISLILSLGSVGLYLLNMMNFKLF